MIAEHSWQFLWENMFWSFRELVSEHYSDWSEYLSDSTLAPADQRYFDSIRDNEAPQEQWTHSLLWLSKFLARKSQRKVMIFVDEYEAPSNRAYEHDFFKTVASFFFFYDYSRELMAVI